MDNIRFRIPLTVSQRQQTIPLGVQAGGGGTRNYNALSNKPAINGHELVGDQTAAELGLATPEDIPTVPTKTSDLTNDSGFVNAAGAAAAAPVQSVNGETGAVTLDAEDVGALPEGSTLDDIPDGATYKRTTAAQVQQISANAANIQTQGGEIDQLQIDVDAIEQKIPNQASAQNKLADKDFVNSSINSAAAYFRGAFQTRAALFAVPWQTADPNAENYVSNNDYAYVADDETHNDEAWRYIYVLQPGGTDNGWQPQFRVNESPLTAAQLAALNSGATAALIEQISTNAAAIALKQAIINASGIIKGNGNGQVSAAVAGTDYQTPLTAGTDYATPAQVNAKYTKPAGGIPASDMAQAVQTSLGLADTALQAVPNTYRTAAAQDAIDNNKAPIIFDTASGSPASFTDGADGLLLKKLVVNIEPVQSGTGDPSPTNVRPISGWTGCSIYHSGADTSDSTTVSVAFPAAAHTVYGGTLTINEDGSGELVVTHAIVSYDKNDTWSKYYGFYATNKVRVNSISQITNGICNYFKVRIGSDTVGFNAVSVQYGGNTYFVPRFYYDAVTTVQEWIDYLAANNMVIQVAYLLDDPVSYQITAQQITALFGTNNIWADCGDVEAIYRADTKLFVEQHGGSGGGVTDVQVNGTSIVQNNVANIPMASASTPGVVISGTVAVTGTTPTITAQPGVRYVCSEVTTLDITLPASGVVDVTFESGSTATVLTITPPTGVTVRWANGFDPDNLEANTTYEINIMDGLGVVAQWT